MNERIWFLGYLPIFKAVHNEFERPGFGLVGNFLFYFSAHCEKGRELKYWEIENNSTIYRKLIAKRQMRNVKKKRQ